VIQLLKGNLEHILGPSCFDKYKSAVNRSINSDRQHCNSIYRVCIASRDKKRLNFNILIHSKLNLIA